MTKVLTKLDARFLATAVDDEVVLMDLHSGSFLTLRDSAVRIWDLIDGSRDRDAILGQVQQDFDGPTDRIERELDAFLAQLRDAGFVA